MEEVRKLEQMILNGEGYSDIIEQSKKVDEWVVQNIGKNRNKFNAIFNATPIKSCKKI